jgi:hypothetical protein
MTSKLSNKLLAFSLFGIALWFFGNLYEGVVIAPNMLKNSVQKMQDWQSFFSITNPVFFYIPITPVAVFIIVFLFLRTPKENAALKSHLKRATIFGLLALVLGVFIITQINFKLFFGDIKKYSAAAYSLSVLWNSCNAIRVALLAITLLHTFKAYTATQQKT